MPGGEHQAAVRCVAVLGFDDAQMPTFGVPAPQHRSGSVDHGGAQIAERGLGVADPLLVAVQPDERVLCGILGAGHVVDEQHRHPDELQPMRRIQYRHVDSRRTDLGGHVSRSPPERGAPAVCRHCMHTEKDAEVGLRLHGTRNNLHPPRMRPGAD